MKKKETNDTKVCTGWTQKWISPDRIRENKNLYIREIVRGPFSSPKLLTTQPIIAVSSGQQVTNVNEHCNNLRHGIPDTWKEYLVRKGFCNSLDACVQQKNVSSFIRSFATERIWNELGLPLVQGIPDPWKCKFLFQRRPAKCLQRRACNDNNSREITRIYDEDDEAEIEHSVKSQFNEDHVVNKKDPSEEEDKESRKKIPLQTSTNNLKKVKNNARKHDDRLPVDKELKSTFQYRKLKNDLITEMKESGKIISNSRPRNKRRMTTLKNEIRTKERLNNERPNRCVHTDTKGEIENHFGCCNCTLQKNHIRSDVKHYSEHVSPLEGTNVSNLVLCQNCENIYYNKHPQQLNNTVKVADTCVSNLGTLQDKIVNRKKIDKRCSFDGTQGCFKKEDHIETKNKISEQELKLICGLCNNSYLKIEFIRADTTCRRSTVTCSKEERHKIRNSMTRKRCRNIAKSSENYCCTCTGNKMHASRGDLEQTPSSTKRGNNVLKRNSCDNNAITKDLSGMKIDTNINAKTKDDIRAEDIVEREVLEDNSKRKTRRRESRNKRISMITDEKSKVKQFQQVRFDSTLKYAVSDSGEYADVSDNFIDGRTNVTSQDTLSVTSITFIRRLKNTIPIRKLYRRLKLQKTYRIRRKMSRPNLIDFEQVLKIEDETTNCNRNDAECNVSYCVDLDNNDIKKI